MQFALDFYIALPTGRHSKSRNDWNRTNDTCFPLMFFAVSEPNGKGWSRTNDVSNVTDLQSAAIANYAYFPKYISCLFAFKIPNFALDKLQCRKLDFITAYGFKIKSLIQNNRCGCNVFFVFSEFLKPPFFQFLKFFGFPDFIFCGIYLPEWALSLVSKMVSDVC